MLDFHSEEIKSKVLIRFTELLNKFAEDLSISVII